MSNRYPPRNALAGQQSKPGWKYHPSNDNSPGKTKPLRMPKRPPLPMNDNFPGRLPKVPVGVPPQVFRQMAGRMLLRGIPIIGWAWTAWEFYNLWADWRAGKYVRPPIGWEKTHEYPLTYSATIGTPQDEYAGFVAWHWEGDLGGIERQSYPTGPDQFPRATHFWWERVVPGKPEYAPLYAVKSRWSRILGAPLLLPPQPVFIPYIHPVDFPGVPLLPLSPQPVPVPVPVRFPKRFRPFLSPQSEAGYGPALKPLPAPNGVTVQSRRPKRNEKERKVTGSKKHLAFLGWILSQYSELGDLVDAFNDALPDGYKSDGNLKDKLKNLYQYWDKVDMTEAVANMVENMVTDPKFAGVFEEMQERQEEFGLDLGGLKGLEGSSGVWSTLR